MKSLRTRLQLWHALVLTVVLAVFGVFVSALAWRTRLQQIDAELERTSGIVFTQLRRLVPPPPHMHRPGHRDPAGMERPPGPPPETASTPPISSVANASSEPSAPNREGREGPGNAGNGNDRPRREGPPPWARFGGREFADPNLTKEFERLFESEGESPLYFVIWNHNGERIQKSASAPEVPFPNLKRNDRSLLPTRKVQTRNDHRELVLVGFFDMNILVGRSLLLDYAEQRTVNAWLAMAGLGVLLVGLLGGWWLSGRALAPLEVMTSTAQKISASNLSERIDLRVTDDELGTLAQVLNATFNRLETAFLQQTRFTADASHELRTPLAVILANLQLALGRPRSAEEYRETLGTCLRASQRMKGLIDNLLILARFDSGDPALQMRPLDLAVLLDECVELLRPLADQRQITMTCRVSSLPISGDFDRLTQVFTNLITNAIRYNRDGGQIDISASRTEDRVVISVADTGIGLPSEAIPHVFERFFRVDKARSRAEGGSGLGLAICRSIVEAHGGEIAVRSDDRGSVFDVSLPLPMPLAEVTKELPTALATEMIEQPTAAALSLPAATS